MLHDRVLVRMKELGISGAELARRAGVSAAFVSQILNEKRGKRLSLDSARKLAKGLRVKQNFFSKEYKHMLKQREGRNA